MFYLAAKALISGALIAVASELAKRYPGFGALVRARIEHVFARQKDQMALFIRTIGIARAETKIGLANLAYNIDRLVFHERRAMVG